MRRNYSGRNRDGRSGSGSWSHGDHPVRRDRRGAGAGGIGGGRGSPLTVRGLAVPVPVMFPGLQVAV
jgi:hypothetical protein